MIETIASAESFVADLSSHIDAFQAIRTPTEKKREAKRLLQEAASAIDVVQQAREEIESGLDRLDEVEDVVFSRLDSKLEHVYASSKGIPNGTGQDLDVLHTAYSRRRQNALTSSAAVLRKVQAHYALRLPPSTSMGAVNALLIGGILGALVFSRYAIIPHAATGLGFIVGTIVVLVAQIILQVFTVVRPSGARGSTATKP